MAQVGSVYLNFGLWAAAIIPAWLVLREIGVAKPGDGDGDGDDSEQSTSDAGEMKTARAVSNQL
ncbi:hypothetical protein BBO_00347 [Beauveria brongniartii RCEF 3172]|uniref:Uncharacterized protein n=1 Tax=Beauveria brongniartii RCEF 3172 TaxID=1081107 RepID=A0A167L1Q0_9HYPO|nr:hypothetical protein BBO_00347 [Beauveria brongniartii RCEF 3172]